MNEVDVDMIEDKVDHFNHPLDDGDVDDNAIVLLPLPVVLLTDHVFDVFILNPDVLEANVEAESFRNVGRQDQIGQD